MWIAYRYYFLIPTNPVPTYLSFVLSIMYTHILISTHLSIFNDMNHIYSLITTHLPPTYLLLCVPHIDSY